MDTIDPIINQLNNKNTGKFYWSVTVLATIGGFLFGYDTSNIGTDLEFIPFYSSHLNPFITGYLVSGASLGAAVGALIAAVLTDRYGRKYLLIADALIYSIGAILSGLSIDIIMLIISRTFIGIAVGADSAIATAYIAEYAPKEKRGRLSILQQWMITIGILGAYLIGMLVFFIAPGLAYAVDWRILLGVAAIPSLIGLAFRLYMPESPRWLILHEKFDKAVDALKKFGIDATMEQIKRTYSYLRATETRIKETAGIKRAFVIVALFMMFQQITGINVPFYYGPVIISKLHLFPSVSGIYSTVYAIGASAILAIINVLATYIGFRLIDTHGRRSLALMGYAGMAFFDFIGTILYLMHFSIGLLIGFAGFIIFFAFGVGGTGWIIQGEYFPTRYRGLFASLIAFVDWISNFAIIEIFPYMDKTIGIGYTMLIFGVLSVMAFITFFMIMPVTRGKSVEDITEMFEDNPLLGVKEASKVTDVNKSETR
ncbi:sugar porter family MFS transporter [Picrophilus oshimae]|uniref:MFS transporter, sugar porter (SP) family n=2 Tax=Picrophilus torridus (strain ATCC 700027 / DSM 9790 / JCM 10055 / NBRC 100828 / KAW 2/3) TaxID=1122961 RepID=A0A8G2L850_PICTO|nr:sugar porter family MFS transporter [Picrophilus oshimae]SMD31034.1 MFS transporter, sugar porter (SP) family [Picrophilus oshimae DSM 9789]